MNLAVPKTPAEYFERTEHAVKHAYAGLNSCWAYIEEARQFTRPPIKEGGMLHYVPPNTPEESRELEHSLKLTKKYHELQISEAMFAGFILEAAYIGIRIFSRNDEIPASCAGFVSAGSTAVPFCIGAQRHNLPVGLIVYAGRNQYAHWDDDQSWPITNAVFAELTHAFYNDPFSDLAFELSNPTIPIYAAEILLTALGWTSYEKYLNEMTLLLDA